MAGSPKCWLGPGWVWLGQILATWPPAACLLPAIPSPVPATGSFTGSHPPATVAGNWRMPAKLSLRQPTPATGASVCPACSQPVPSVCASHSPALCQPYISTGVTLKFLCNTNPRKIRERPNTFTHISRFYLGIISLFLKNKTRTLSIQK